MDRYRIIDLFAGCGGLTDGFEQTRKYETVACVEWDKPCCDTLTKRLRTKWKYNDADQRVLRFDIQRTDELINGWNNDKEYGSHQGLESLVLKNGNVDVIIGGPPCQAYSIAGRVRDEYGMHNDYRNYLFESYLKIVGHFKPKVVLFENVPGMLSAAPGGLSIVKRLSSTFRETGYEIVDDIKEVAQIDFTQYGVPQKRKRVILLGINKSIFQKSTHLMLDDFYQNFLPSYTRKKHTVFDAIGDLPKIYPLKNTLKKNGRQYSHEPIVSVSPNHIPRFNNKRDIETFKVLAADIASSKNHYNSADRIKKFYQERTGKISSVHKYYVLRWNEQSNTIPAHLYKDGLRHIHPDPEQARTITVREAARLQTFADDFEFLGSMSNQYKMVGNAVPPLFAKNLGSALLDLLKNYQLNSPIVC